MSQEVYLETLVGKHVLDVTGERAGRLEEVIAAEQDGEFVVVEYHIGPSALLERFAAVREALWLKGAISKQLRKGYRVPWQQMNLSDPEQPRLRCTCAELIDLHVEGDVTKS